MISWQATQHSATVTSAEKEDAARAARVGENEVLLMCWVEGVVVVEEEGVVVEEEGVEGVVVVVVDVVVVVVEDVVVDVEVVEEWSIQEGWKERASACAA